MIDPIGVIPVFVAVVEQGGFAPAARLLGVSKSAVSKRISHAEERMGVRLLHRTTRKLSLTEAGERYFAYAVEALAAAKLAEDSVSEMQTTPQGRLRLNVPMSFGRLHIAPLIPQFLARFPKIDVDMVMDDTVVDIVANGYDIAIRGGTLSDSGLVARRIAPIRNVLCASPDYLERMGCPAVPADLAQHDCLHYSNASDGREWVMTGPGGEVRVATAARYCVNNSEALLAAVLAGSGIGRIPTFVCSGDLAAGRLVRLLPDFAFPEQAFYAVFPERRHLPIKVRSFIDFMRERFGGDTPYWDRAMPSG
ncbi:LysR family transcriptional regulator [Pacificispira sp.]|uniref:LysR family transcriptional regulator n=1 Tax=Pacificispira sp. TaxID=2888761 RepID=UPI003BA95F39